jgi:transcriptional regulator NrdR family protein
VKKPFTFVFVIDLRYKEDRHFKVKRRRTQVECKSRDSGITTWQRREAESLKVEARKLKAEG